MGSAATVAPAAWGVVQVLGPGEGMGRSCLGVRRIAAVICVLGLEGTEPNVKAGVEGRGQRGQRPQGQVLAAAEDLAHTPGRDAHAGSEVSPGETTLPHMPVDLVRQLRDEGEHLFVDLGICSPLIWRNA